MTVYNKLVRDLIPDIIAAKGQTGRFHTANDAEYWEKLKTKLQEEVAEFLEAENTEELADILEVLDAIYTYKKFSLAEIEAVKQKKQESRGGFTKRLILEES